MNTASRFAIVAAAGLFVGGLALSSANAADLGGDCCADLEERVADLEATTVRKGNKKVSLTISGNVTRVIGWIKDEDGDSEFYSAGSNVAPTQIQFDGTAKLSSTWTAGYQLRFRANEDTSANVLTEAGGSFGTSEGYVKYDRNFVYLSNASIGTFAAGMAGAPTDGVANISLAGRDVTGDSEGTDWNGIATGFDLENDDRYQAIAYISPTIAGFTLAVAWADLNSPAVDDSGLDAWDAALRYAGEFGPIRVAAGIGYTTADDGTEGANLMGSAAVMHVPTGLNVAFAAGEELDGGLASGGVGPDAQYWHVQGGINQNFFGMGNTSIYGEYGNYDTGVAADDETTMWGLGLVQTYDAAATELFVAYRQWNDDDDLGTDGDVQQIMGGMRISF